MKSPSHLCSLLGPWHKRQMYLFSSWLSGSCLKCCVQRRCAHAVSSTGLPRAPRHHMLRAARGFRPARHGDPLPQSYLQPFLPPDSGRANMLLEVRGPGRLPWMLVRGALLIVVWCGVEVVSVLHSRPWCWSGTDTALPLATVFRDSLRGGVSSRLRALAGVRAFP